jgi:argininosuccinate lyase
MALERGLFHGLGAYRDPADYLAKKGVPFRDAHETVARAVKAAIASGVDLAALPLATLQQFNPAIGQDVYGVLSLRGSLDARDILGGTAPTQVRAQVARHRARLS